MEKLLVANELTLNSDIWAWSNMANTFDVALWARFFVVPRRVAVLRDDMVTTENGYELMKIEFLQLHRGGHDNEHNQVTWFRCGWITLQHSNTDVRSKNLIPIIGK